MFNKSDVRSFARNQYRVAPKPSNAWRVGALIAVIVLVLVVAAKGQAQELPNTACPNDAQTVFLTAITDNLSVLMTDVNTALVAMRGAIDTYQLACTGGVVTSETHPSGIVGPLTFDGTLYEITITLPEGENMFGSVELTDVEGDCGYGTFVAPDFNVGGSESEIMEFGGDCVALFEVDTDETWTLTFKKIK